MKKNNNGFTLVEVLGVIVILGILGLLVTNAIMGYFEEGKDDYNKKLADQLVVSGKNYFSDNRYLLPTEISDEKYAFVTVPNMQSGNYIKNEFVDSEGKKCTQSYVFVTESNPGSGSYDYTPCLICEGENYTAGSKYCDPNLWKTEKVEEPTEKDDVDHCLKTGDNGGYTEDKETGECVCLSDEKGEKVEINGSCVYVEKHCPEETLAKGYTDSNGVCKCLAPKREIGGECKCAAPRTYNEKTNKCDCPEGTIDVNGECKDNTPVVPEVGDFSCTGTYEVATGKTIISASSTYPINRIYYVPSGGTAETNLSLTSSEKSNGKITNKTYTSIPNNASVYIEDVKSNTSGRCRIKDCECSKLSLGYTQGTSSCSACSCKSPKIEKKIDGVMHCVEANKPVCTFTKVPTGYVGPSGAAFRIKCTNEVRIKNLDKTKITSKNGYGNLIRLTAKYANEDTKLTVIYDGTYKPVSGSHQRSDRIKAGVGLVGNSSDNTKQNAQVISDSISIDTKPPVITFTVTSGSTMTSSASGESGTKGYKGSVKVKVTCTDSGSGVKTFKVNGTSYSSSKTLTYSSRGSHTISASCTDKAGNSASDSKSYRVCTSSSNCNKCGVASYKSCRNSHCSCQTYYASCGTCGGARNTKTCYNYSYYWWIPRTGTNGYTSTGRLCGMYCNSSNYGRQCSGGGATYAATCTRRVSSSYTCYASGYKYCYRCWRAGCQTYYSCRHSVCGVASCKSCYYCK